MLLSQVLTGIDGELIGGDDSVDITSIEYDSRKVGVGSLFAALNGVNTDGNKYAKQAVENGAVVVLSDAPSDDIAARQLITTDTRMALRKLSENFFLSPETQLELVAITGTNGKTTIAQIIAHALKKLGKKCGVLGTVEYDLVSEVIPAPLTTPESPDFQEYLSRMVSNNTEYAVCEFSSQALAQERVAGDNVNYAVFTNLSRDHLDNHGNMENYFSAKKRLFDKLSAESVAIVNSSDSYAERIVEDTRARVIKVGYNLDDDIRIINAEYEVKQTHIDILVLNRHYSISSALIGEYNAMNLLEAMAVLYSAGFGFEEIIGAVGDFSGAGGRLERFESVDGRVAFVDYAHTDDALDNALTVLKKITRGKLIVVFGCGGDRDRGKRALMASVAEKKADTIILTNDNPRTEDPEQIMNDMLKGIQDKSQISIEFDRAKAIRAGLDSAKEGDVVLVAGKGHEDYQIIGGKKIHFDDREVVTSILSSV